MLVALLGAVLLPQALAGAGRTTVQQTIATSSLMSRVGPPSEQAVRDFKGAGMEQVRPHELTPAERARVEAALSALPALNRDALTQHLHQLAFVDGIPGEGSGLTSISKGGRFDLTFRASIIDESLSTFLTTKERRVFTDDGSGATVTITGTGTNALTYVLLHESSHVLDLACGLTKTFPNPFDRDIWASERRTDRALAKLLATRTYFHGGPKLPEREAPEVYDSLSMSPFVSLYSTSSAREDFAELVAWREIQHLYGGTLTVRVDTAGAAENREWHPLTFTQVQSRLVQVDRLERLGRGCPAH